MGHAIPFFLSNIFRLSQEKSYLTIVSFCCFALLKLKTLIFNTSEKPEELDSRPVKNLNSLTKHSLHFEIITN